MDYRTEDGSANAGSDYEYSEGTLVFKPGETHREIKVSEERRERRHLDMAGMEMNRKRTVNKHKCDTL